MGDITLTTKILETIPNYPVMSASFYLTPHDLLATFLSISGLMVSPIASAQVASDGTVQTQVNTLGNQLEITEGTQAGSNLFHSFSQFSVPSGFEAYFNNSSTISNIISRVTGGSISNIEGLIRANGTANLFLINPNGIVFGPNAVVDIGGSFLATTAESIQFADGSQFSATNSQSSPILTIAVPVGLQFGSNPGTIVNRAHRTVPDPTPDNPNNTRQVGFEVKSGNTIALVGGDLDFQGGRVNGSGGRVELGSVGGNSRVQLSVTNPGLEIDYQGVTNFQDISLSQQSIVDVNNSTIQVQGSNIRLTNGSQISSTTRTTEDAGDLTVNATESVELIGAAPEGFPFPSAFIAQVNPGGTGRGGNLIINTKQLSIREGAGISVASQGEGIGGRLEVNVSEAIEITGTGRLFPSVLTSSTDGTGDGGEIVINTRQLTLSNGGQIQAFTISQGRGGTITINASDSIEVSGRGALPEFNTESFSSITAESGFQLLGFTGIAPGGNVNINTNQLIVTDGGTISAGSFGQGNAGSVDITSNSIFLDNQGVITASSEGSGDAGNITILTDQLSVNNQSEISVRNIGFGQGGNLTISADAISLNQDSQLTAVSFPLEDLTLQELGINAEEFVNRPNIGNAGDLILNTSSLNLNNDSQVTVSSFGTGNAGSMGITAQNIALDNSSELAAETASGEGGNISLYVSDFLNLRRASTISTTAGTLGGGGNGGNIFIDAEFMVTVPTENSDIIANAFLGNGGNIRINASGVFGIEERERLTPLNDITASSQFGQVGSIGINRPDVDPQRSLVKLPGEVVDAKNLVVQACSPGGAYTRGEFSITGSGGLPVNPDEGIQTSPGLTELGYPEIEMFNQSDNQESLKIPNESLTPDYKRQSSPTTIVEAQGWIMDKNGKVVLTAQSPNVTPHGSGFMPSNCYDLSNRSLSSATSPSPSLSDVPQRNSLAE